MRLQKHPIGAERQGRLGPTVGQIHAAPTDPTSSAGELHTMRGINDGRRISTMILKLRILLLHRTLHHSRAKTL